MSVWKPIQTAPHDGTVIIAIGDPWDYPYAELILWSKTHDGWSCYGEEELEVISPKYWMDCPAFPQDLKNESVTTGDESLTFRAHYASKG